MPTYGLSGLVRITQRETIEAASQCLWLVFFVSFQRFVSLLVGLRRCEESAKVQDVRNVVVGASISVKKMLRNTSYDITPHIMNIVGSFAFRAMHRNLHVCIVFARSHGTRRIRQCSMHRIETKRDHAWISSDRVDAQTRKRNSRLIGERIFTCIL